MQIEITDTSATLPQPVGRMKSIDITPPFRASTRRASSVMSIFTGRILRSRSATRGAFPERSGDGRAAALLQHPVVDDDAAALAVGADVGELGEQPLADPLARHLDEPELGDVEHL